MTADIKRLNSEKIKNLNINTRGKVGEYTAQVNRHGQQLVYNLHATADEPSSKQVDARQRFKQCSQRIAALDEKDIISWKNRVAGKSNTYQGEFVSVVQKAYYSDDCSFNLIRGVQVIKRKTDCVDFAFTFDVPGDFIIRHRKKLDDGWQKDNFTLHKITEEKGSFSLLKLSPDTQYFLRIIQPRNPIQNWKERKLGTVGKQAVPTHIKGESGDYCFQTASSYWGS